MATVYFTETFIEELRKKFTEQEGNRIIDLLETLEENPYKGKEIGVVGGILIKEMKYSKYRFYFITDGYKLKVLKSSELKDLMLKFVRISDKKEQQKVIEEIKAVLRKLGEEGF